MKTPCSRLLKLLFLVTLFTGASVFAGENCAPGIFIWPGSEYWVKPDISEGKYREKWSLLEGCTSDLVNPIFDKEKEQNRIREAQLLGEIGSQVGDITRTQGDLEGLKAAKGKHGDLPLDELRNTQEYKDAMKQYGTGSVLQQGIQAATAAIQGLAGGDMAKALAGASAPYLAEVIHKMTTDAKGNVNKEANLMAHSVLGAVTSAINGNSALAGAAGAATAELMAPAIIAAMGWDKNSLTEEQKQTVVALSSLAAGLAGGLAGDSTGDALAGAQAGKNAVENNFLSVTQLDNFAQKARTSALPR